MIYPLEEEATYDCDPYSTFRALVLPSSQQRLKKLTTRRRRLKRYAGGIEGIRDICVTLTYCLTPDGYVIAWKTKINPHHRKGMSLGEGYIFETEFRNEMSLVGVCHVLIHLLRLMLQDIQLKLYCDGEHYWDGCLLGGSDYLWRFYQTLRGWFHQIDIEYPSTGGGIKELKKHLDAHLPIEATNKIVASELGAIIDRYYASLSIPD